MSYRNILSLLLIGAALAACQPLPQPFQPEVKGRAVNPLMRPIGETSLFVAPVAGLPAEQGARLAQSLADALAEQEVPASNDARSVLSSTLTVSLAPQGSQTVWRWSKQSPDKSVQSGGDRPLGIAIDRLDAGDEGAIKQAAAAMAAAIAAKLNEDTAGVLAQAKQPRLSVLECDGAPGDGNRSLRQALREILILTGQPPVADPAQADYLIACHVKVWADGPNSERVAIEWALMTNDGRRLGEVKQGNRIPRGQLAQAWGNTAHIIAEGGWQGLSKILETQQRPTLPPKPARS
ncbi:MAG TPA: hypothetical protein VF194_09685 [Ferrovibrio sp.]|uniref:hypothetical protein n=1 Tax=Ferrovibrio sp. TaxID=1917215 RepID=UPI002ED347F9